MSFIVNQVDSDKLTVQYIKPAEAKLDWIVFDAHKSVELETRHGVRVRVVRGEMECRDFPFKWRYTVTTSNAPDGAVTSFVAPMNDAVRAYEFYKMERRKKEVKRHESAFARPTYFGQPIKQSWGVNDSISGENVHLFSAFRGGGGAAESLMDPNPHLFAAKPPATPLMFREDVVPDGGKKEEEEGKDAVF